MKPIEKQEFSSEYKELVLHLDTQNQNDVIVQLYKKYFDLKILMEPIILKQYMICLSLLSIMGYLVI